MLHNECKRAFDEGGRKHGVGNRGLIGLKLSKLSDEWCPPHSKQPVAEFFQLACERIQGLRRRRATVSSSRNYVANDGVRLRPCGLLLRAIDRMTTPGLLAWQGVSFATGYEPENALPFGEVSGEHEDRHSDVNIVLRELRCDRPGDEDGTSNWG